MLARLRWLLMCGFSLVSCPLPGQDALHSRIDQLVDAAAVSPPAPACSDGEFLRRAMLDLNTAVGNRVVP